MKTLRGAEAALPLCPKCKHIVMMKTVKLYMTKMACILPCRAAQCPQELLSCRREQRQCGSAAAPPHNCLLIRTHRERTTISAACQHRHFRTCKSRTIHFGAALYAPASQTIGVSVIVPAIFNPASVQDDHICNCWTIILEVRDAVAI